MKIQFRPDKVYAGTPAQIEEASGLAFKGAGFYLYKQGSAIVVRQADVVWPWAAEYKLSELFWLYYWADHDVADTINALANAPTRVDARD